MLYPAELHGHISEKCRPKPALLLFKIVIFFNYGRWEKSMACVLILAAFLQFAFLFAPRLQVFRHTGRHAPLYPYVNGIPHPGQA